MSIDPLLEAHHSLPSSQPSIVSSAFSSIRHEGTAPVTPCSSSSLSLTFPASNPVRRSSVIGFEPPADTTAAEGDPLSLSSLERRTKVLEEERQYYVRLGQRSADAFEEHRRELTQLAQKERAIRCHREDVLRAQLQETLEANHELLGRVAEQQQRYEGVRLVELQEHRSDNAREDESGSALKKLHEEWAELQRGIAETEASHEEHRRSLAACLRDQEHLRSRVRSLQDRLRSAEAADALTGPHGGAFEGGREQMESVTAPANCARGGWAETPPSSRSLAASPQLTRQPCCSHSDVSPNAQGGSSSPKRRVLRRHFVPSGPWDACSPCRASSPCSHHIEAMVATIQRENYLRPRLYYRRVGRGSTDMARISTAVTSPYRQHRRGVSASRSSPPPAPDACTSSISCAPATPARHGHHPHHHICQDSLGLSSSTSSDTTTTPTTTSYTSTATGSSSCCLCPAPAHTQASSTTNPRSHSPCVKHRDEHRCGEASPHRLGCCSFSLRTRGEGTAAAKQASAVPRLPPHRGVPSTAPHSFRVPLPAQPRPPPPPAADGLHGAALNTACRALITDLAELRVEYRRFQRQLRDPHGHSVTASQEMRRLMHEMDAKSAQIRKVRLEQARHNDALRVQDVLREVMMENRYCEAVYNDLLDLIRT
ncbi:hypothetical protein JKF63_03656 [Porcisia hertigi]|uniref:Uncharacterized protein n=1 Tax=Porcisia hertigi TaxID=2761500 RepID=A0A836HIL9_9TRYP|nr:hypothetical protein JKF63_03656 [Porcisia hertigi]